MTTIDKTAHEALCDKATDLLDELYVFVMGSKRGVELHTKLYQTLYEIKFEGDIE